ncbi:MAG: hypothetical protein AAGA22_00075 [Pseudomonadota bacterium]
MAKQEARKSLWEEFTFARVGLGIGAAAIFASTAFMNVSGWVAQADDTAQAVANGLLASGFELMALCGLSWAGWQYARKRKAAAMIAGAIAIVAIVFNTFAAENFLHLQGDELVNAIETSGQTVEVSAAEIDALQAQLDSIVQQNGGNVPRPIDAIEAQYAHLDEESNPINMGRRDAEIALRKEYERLSADIRELRRDASGASVTANDTARTVIPSSLLGPFVWALEVIKGTIFFALGTATGTPKQTAEDRQKWAIIRAKEEGAKKPMTPLRPSFRSSPKGAKYGYARRYQKAKPAMAKKADAKRRAKEFVTANTPA